MNAHDKMRRALRLLRKSPVSLKFAPKGTPLTFWNPHTEGVGIVPDGPAKRGASLGKIRMWDLRRKHPDMTTAIAYHEYGHLVNRKLGEKLGHRSSEQEAWRMGRALLPPHLRPRSWRKIERRTLESYGKVPFYPGLI